MRLSSTTLCSVTPFMFDTFLMHFCTQVLRTREDGVLIVNRHDGTRIVEYLDGTRVTTAVQSRCEHVVDQETGESVDKDIFYTTITVLFLFFEFKRGNKEGTKKNYLNY